MNAQLAKIRRNPWPYSITAFFVAAITFFACFITWAVRLRDDLVTPNYYEREVKFQAELDSLNRSQAFAKRSVVTFDPTQESIVITLPEAGVAGATGSVHLYRPSDARLDRELPLALNAEGKQFLDAKLLRDGLWKVRVKWRVADQDYLVDQPVVVSSGS